MKHAISFSTGLSSALTVERVLQRYDPADCFIVFMNTQIEDKDNYRFRDEIYDRWHRIYPGWHEVNLADGRTPYEVAEDEKMIFNQRRHPCTRLLKIEPFRDWLKESNPDVIHIGFDFTEIHRCKVVTDNYAPIQVDFPLLWKPYELRPYTEVSKEDWGIKPPRMYSRGYSHANCGGVCFAQGWGDWLRTLEWEPEKYRQVEKWEQEMRQRPGLENYAICRDQSSGTVTPLTLRELRQRHKGKQMNQLSLLDGEMCVQCGIV